MTMLVPSPIGVPMVSIHLMNLAECVCEQLAANGAGPTCWCGLYPGADVSWDYCGECAGSRCGMGYVRLAGGFPYETFPQPIVDNRCTRPLAWAVEVGSLRCIPQTSDGAMLGPDEMSEVAISQVLDAQALYVAIKCCPGLSMAVETYVPVGPAGGCVGGYWTAFAPIDEIG